MDLFDEQKDEVESRDPGEKKTKTPNATRTAVDDVFGNRKSEVTRRNCKEQIHCDTFLMNFIFSTSYTYYA